MLENNATLFATILTNKPLEAVHQAIVQAFRNLGGGIQVLGNIVTITNGKQGVSNGFTMQLVARIVIEQRKPGEYQLTCNLTYSPDQIFWICGIVGFFCLWPAWIVNLLYFTSNPVPVYQSALDRVPIEVQTV